MINEVVLLDNLEKVNKFVGITAAKSYDIYLTSGKYVVNAKSIMGVFSLDLTKPLNVQCQDDPEFLDQIKEFIPAE
jgi:phosphotransferase system HPr-like phosphotransfer protein